MERKSLLQLRSCIRQLCAIIKLNRRGFPFDGTSKLIQESAKLCDQLGLPQAIGFRLDIDDEEYEFEEEPQERSELLMLLLEYPFGDKHDHHCARIWPLDKDVRQGIEQKLHAESRRGALRCLRIWNAVLDEWQSPDAFVPQADEVGPRPPNLVKYPDGVIVKLSPKQWALVRFLWSQPDKMASIESVCEEIYSSHNEANEKALSSQITRTNTNFLKEARSTTISTSARCVTLKW